VLLAPPAAATDLSLLAGYQYNDEFEFSDEAALTPEEVGGVPGDDIDVDGGAAFSLALDLDIFKDPNQRIGLYLSHHQATIDSDAGLVDDEMGVTHLHFTGMNYYPRGNWEHFVLAGIGATFFDPDDSTLDSDTRFSMQVGGGTAYRLTDNLLLRIDARWIPAFFNESSSGICSGGCVIAVKSETYSQIQVNAGITFRF
jgi:opacity protein-like surface antigen